MPVRVGHRSSAWEGRAARIKRILDGLGFTESPGGRTKGYILDGTGDAVEIYYNDSNYMPTHGDRPTQLVKGFLDKARPALVTAFRGRVSDCTSRSIYGQGLKVGPRVS